MLFSKFKLFLISQKKHFIKTLIFPILTFNRPINIGIFQQLLTIVLNSLRFSTGTIFILIHKLANIFAELDDHVLNACYTCPRTEYLLQKIRTNRFLESFIPTSNNVLNITEQSRNHCNLSLTILLKKVNLNLNLKWTT